MHLEDTADTLLLALSGVKHIRTGRQGTGVNSEECQLTNIWVSHNLESQCGERLLVAGRTLVLFAGVRVNTLDSSDINWCRHKVYNSIQHWLYASVTVRSTTGYRAHLAGDGCLTDNCLDFLLGNLLTLKVLHCEVIIQIRKSLHELLTILFSLILHISWDFNFVSYLTEVILVDDSFHLNQVDNALEVVLSTDWQLNSNCIGLKTLMHHIDYIEEICTSNVHLIYISHSWYTVFLSLTPYGFSLRLNATASSKNCYSTVQYTQRTLYLHSEVNMARGINDIDTMVLPVTSSSSGSDGNTTLLLLLHPVHGSCAFMNLTNLMVDTCVEEDTLSSGCLTGIDVSHDTDITSLFETILSCHLYIAP